MIKRLLKKTRINRRFRVERALIKGAHRSSSSKKSVIHFSVNKAATQYVKGVLRKTALENQMVPVHLHHYAFLSGMPYFDSLTNEEMEKYQHIFKKQGYVYTVFGGFIENIEAYQDYKIIFTVRDPRDIAVSAYYSFSYSHGVPLDETKSAEFMKMRNKALSISVDEFALDYSDEVLETYTNYLEGFKKLSLPVELIRYEDMVADYPKWLDHLLQSTDLSMSAELRRQLMEEVAQKQNKSENVKSHNRKGVAGDYLEKLKPETIDALNQKFARILDYFDYK